MRIVESDISAPAAQRDIEPLALPICDAIRVSGLSRSEVYRRLAAGDIRAVKAGAKTLVLTQSLKAFLSGLPAATFTAAPRHRA